MRRFVVGLVCMLAGLFCVGQSTADTIFDGGAPGYNPIGYTPGWNLTDAVVANDFEVGTSSLLTGVTFWTLEPNSGNFDGTINWFIFLNNGDKPALIAFAQGGGLLTSREPTVLGFQYDFSLDTSVSLNANQRYWLGIDLNEGTAVSSIYWVAPAGWVDPPLESTFFGEVAKRTPSNTWDFTEWGSNYYDGAFSLSGRAIPTPSSLTALLGLGTMGLFAAARRKRSLLVGHRTT